MQFIKIFLRNLGVLIILGLGLLVLFPDMVGQMFQFYGLLFPPGLILLMVAVAAWPRRRRRRY